MNAPDILDAVFLGEEEQKVVVIKDSKIQNAGTFYFTKEDHTLGNALRMSLLRDKDVRFAGYRMPHPLQTVLEVKVQTNGEATPIQAVISSLQALENEFAVLENRFASAMTMGGAALTGAMEIR